MRGGWKTYKLHFIWSSSADTLCLLSTKENWSLFDGLFKLSPFLFNALFKPWAVILATVLSGSQHYFCRDASAHCAVSLHVKNKGHICTSTLCNCIFCLFFSFWIIFDNVCRKYIDRCHVKLHLTCDDCLPCLKHVWRCLKRMRDETSSWSLKKSSHFLSKLIGLSWSGKPTFMGLTWLNFLDFWCITFFHSGLRCKCRF